MDNLTFELKQLCRRNRAGGAMTQAQRIHSLTSIARQLKQAGFSNMRAASLSGKHVDALLERWNAENLSVGTIKNRLSDLRFWAEKVGKAGVLPADNARLGIPRRQSAGSGESKAKGLDSGQLDRITDLHVRMSLRLQQAFGLRREESIKFQPAYADRGDHIVLKGSWAKGGRERAVPITTPEQRVVLDQVHALAGSDSLIPLHLTYIQQRHVYDGQCKAAGLCSRPPSRTLIGLAWSSDRGALCRLDSQMIWPNTSDETQEKICLRRQHTYLDGSSATRLTNNAMCLAVSGSCNVQRRCVGSSLAIAEHGL